MSGIMPRLRIFQAQDHFGPGLVSEPYWYAEVYDAGDPTGRQLWAAGFGPWIEALRGGCLALADARHEIDQRRRQRGEGETA